MISLTGKKAIFQSTPSAWRVTTRVKAGGTVKIISIHTLRVEGDIPILHIQILYLSISIHTLRVEGDVVRVNNRDIANLISIHTLRVEGDSRLTILYFFQRISIHTLRVEGDPGRGS